VRDAQFIERRTLTYGNRSQSGGQMANLPKTESAQPFQDTPGYHGSLFINPSTGAILRVTLEAELKESDPITRAASVVEYGPVRIGDQSYICPLRSVAISTEPPTYKPNGEPADPSILLVNEATFAQYHRLGSTIRMLADAAPGDPAAPSSDGQISAAASSQPQPQSAAAVTPDAPAAGSPPSPASASSGASMPTPASSSANPASDVATAVNSVPLHEPPPANPEITLEAAGNVPDQAAFEPDSSTVTLKMTSRLVDVGLVVLDKKGHPVSGLNQGDFELYDNGRKQEVRFFTQSSAAPAPVAPVTQEGQPTFSNRAGDTVLAPASQPEPVTSVLLLDESHVAWADLNNAREQVVKFLNAAAPGERVGLYSMTERGFKVLKEITTDHAAIIARLKTWMPSAQSVLNAQDEETRNRQQFNEVHNVADLNSVNGNHTDVPDAEQTVDPQLLTMGDNPGRAALIILGGVARHLSALPGHKNLIWISSDNVFADWRDQAVGIDKSPKLIDRLAVQAQEAMNDAHASVYPFDVSQLEAGTISADIQHRNVELTQAAQDSAALAATGGGSGRGSGTGGGSGRDMTPGRQSAEMSQDLHPIQGPIRQVAEATGGRTIRRSGDLAAEMAGIVAEGHSSYRISFYPDTNADNRYHNIAVKLVGKHGYTARYRTGYFYAAEPGSLRERFQQAVWRPMDSNEIAVTANVGLTGDGANIKINVATGDLGMRQRVGRWADRLDIFFIQRDDIGVHAQVEGQRMGLFLKPETYQSLLPSGVPYEHVVHLKPGTATVRVLVVDENSGRMGSITIPADALGGQS
jgi:VWFA-related protein